MERGVKVNILGFQTNKKRKTKKSVDLEEFENLSRILKPEKQKQQKITKYSQEFDKNNENISFSRMFVSFCCVSSPQIGEDLVNF